MFNRKLLSISIASIVLTSSLTVSANTQKDDENKDSVNTWGKWSQNYSTAAGGEINSQVLAVGVLSSLESGQVEQNQAGFESDNSGARNFASWGYSTSCCSANQGTKKATINYSVDGAEGNFIVSAADEVYESEVLNRNNRTVGGVGYNQGYFLSGNNLDWTFLTFEQGDGNYYRGFWYEDTSNGMGWPSNNGFFIVGDTSDLSAVNDLAVNVIAGNVSGSFSGDFLGNRGGVDIVVKFGGQASWSGEFRPDNFSSFEASGNIEGVNLVGNITSENVGGSVSASFFGDGAQVIAGIAEATSGGNDFAEVFEAHQTERR